MLIKLIIGFLAFLVLVLLIEITRRKIQKNNSPDTSARDRACASDNQCCGLHEICEKGKRKPGPVEYYDDEELDAFKGRISTSYTEEEINQFQEVLASMFRSDVPGWEASLQARKINLPEALKSEIRRIKEQ